MWFFSKQDGTKIHAEEKQVHTHTYTCAYPSEHRKFKYCGKHTLFTTNNCTIRYTKGKSICSYMLKKIDYLQNLENTLSLSGKKVSMDARPESRGEGKKSCTKQQSLSFPPEMSVPTDH